MDQNIRILFIMKLEVIIIKIYLRILIKEIKRFHIEEKEGLDSIVMIETIILVNNNRHLIMEKF